MKTRTVQVIEVDDWNKLVTETYGRPYNLQDQDTYFNNGVCLPLSVPELETNDNEADDDVPEKLGEGGMVKLATWLARDPQTPEFPYSWERELWWYRDFYPDLAALANDLHERGLLPAGEYMIHVWW